MIYRRRFFPEPVAGPRAARRLRRRAGRARRTLQQSVGEAEFAVLAAQAVGASTGELDTLCLRLRLASEAAGYSPSTADLLAAARMIRDAAAAAIASLPESDDQPGDADRPRNADRPRDADRPGDADLRCEAIGTLIARAAQAAAGRPLSG